MDGLREYVIAIAAAAMLSGILIRLTQSSGSREIIKMLCGIFMTIVMVQPIVGKKALLLDTLWLDTDRQTKGILAEGTATADKIRREFIKQRVETYILSRAEAMEADIQANVSLDENCIPASVRIVGRISPLSRGKLTQIIASELGITKERQEWIG